MFAAPKKTEEGNDGKQVAKFDPKFTEFGHTIVIGKFRAGKSVSAMIVPAQAQNFSRPRKH